MRMRGSFIFTTTPSIPLYCSFFCSLSTRTLLPRAWYRRIELVIMYSMCMPTCALIALICLWQMKAIRSLHEATCALSSSSQCLSSVRSRVYLSVLRASSNISRLLCAEAEIYNVPAAMMMMIASLLSIVA